MDIQLDREETVHRSEEAALESEDPEREDADRERRTTEATCSM